MMHTHFLRQCVVIVLAEDQNNSNIFHRDISYSHDLFLNVLLRCQKYSTVLDILHNRSTFLSNSRFYTHVFSTTVRGCSYITSYGLGIRAWGITGRGLERADLRNKEIRRFKP